MIPGYIANQELPPQLQRELERLHALSWALVSKIATTAPTRDTLATGFSQVFDDGQCRRIYYNLNGTVYYWPLLPGVIFGATQQLVAADVILPNAEFVPVVGKNGAVTLTSDPMLPDGCEGQIVKIKGTDNTNTVTLTRGQGVLLQASVRVLGLNDILALYFDPITTDWHELYYSNL